MSDKTPASRQLLNITKALLDEANAENNHIRNATIEECARVVLNFEVGDSPHKIKLCEQLAAAIRARISHEDVVVLAKNQAPSPVVELRQAAFCGRRMTDVLLKRAEVARQLRVSEDTVKRMDTRGQLPKVTLSPRIVRYRQSDIDAIIASGSRSSFSRYEIAPNDRDLMLSRQLVGTERPAVTRSAPIGKNFHK